MGEIKKQSIYNATFSYLGAFLGYLIICIQPHIVSSNDIGLLRLLYSFSFIAATLMPLGIGNFIMRSFPFVKDEKTKNHGLFFVIVLITTFGGILVLSGLIIYKSFFVEYYKNSPGIITYYYHSIAIGYVIALNLVLTIYCNCLLKTTYLVFLNDVLVRLGQLILLGVYFLGYVNTDSFILANLSLYAVQLIFILLYLFSLNVISFNISWSFLKNFSLKELLFTSFLMTVTGFISLSVRFLDQLQVGHFLSQKEVGIYASCVMIAVLIEIPLRSMEKIAQPKLSLAWKQNDIVEISDVYEKSSRYMFFLGSVLFCMMFANINLMFAFLPKEFSAGKISLLVVAISSLINLLSGLNSAIIVISHKFYILSIGLVLQIALALYSNNLLIPIYGITGAAISTLIAYAIFNFLMSSYNYVRFKIHPFSTHTIYIGTCLLLNLIILRILSINLNPYINAIVSSLIVAGSFLYISIRFKIIPEITHWLVSIKAIKE